MPLDLSTAKIFARGGVRVESDHLLVVEYRGTADRLWRVPFDRIRRVVVVRRAPLGRITTVVLLAWLPALAMMLPQEPVVAAWGAVIALLGTAFAGWYALLGKTTVHLSTEDRTRSFTTITRRQKVERFLDKLRSGIQRVQDAKREELGQA